MKKEEIIRKIMKETGKPLKLATVMANRIVTIREELRPCVLAWVKNEKLDFAFQDITLDEIMTKEKCSYLEAIFSMQVLMDKPHLASQYKSFDFRRK